MRTKGPAFLSATAETLHHVSTTPSCTPLTGHTAPGHCCTYFLTCSHLHFCLSQKLLTIFPGKSPWWQKERSCLIWFCGRKAATGICSAASAGRKPGVILGQEGRDSCLSYNLTVTSFAAARFLSFLVILLNGRMQLILQYLSPPPLTTKQSWRIESFILPLRGCFLSRSGH